jgi:hypothetical protein
LLRLVIFFPDFFILILYILYVLALIIRIQQRVHHDYRPGCIEYVHRLPTLIIRFYLHGSVLLGCSGAPNQQRHINPMLGELLGIKDHFIQGGGDQPRETNDVSFFKFRTLNNLLAVNHHAHIDNFIVITAKDYTHDVLTDVMHVTLDGG